MEVNLARRPEKATNEVMTEKMRRRKAMFSALASETRLNILYSLGRGEKNVSTLVEELGVGQTLVSHNLRKLAEAGFVSDRKDGNYRYYTLNKEVARQFFGLVTTMEHATR